GDATLRISSTVGGVGGNLAGILSAIAIEAGTGTNDRLFVDDFTTSGDRTGVVGYDPGDLTHAAHDFIAGLGMSIGNAVGVTRPNLVQVVTVLGATDGRFVLHVNGQDTIQLDFDTTAAKMQQALETILGAGTVEVSKAGGRWAIAYKGTLAGDAGWASQYTITFAAVA